MSLVIGWEGPSIEFTLRHAVRWLVATGLVCWQMPAGAELFPTRIFTATQAIAAIASGDFDSVHPGNELACLMADGSVVELALEKSGWKTNTIFVYKESAPPWEDPRARVTLNIGDVLSERAGQELVLSYYQQVVAIYFSPSTGWTNQIVADYKDTFGTSWGAEVGDCDYARAGEEVFSIHEGVFDFSSGTVFERTNGGWGQNLVYNAEVAMDAAIGNSNPDLTGDEIIVVTEMGPAYEILPPAGGGSGPWEKRTIWDDSENAGWVAKIGDLDPERNGNEIIYGTRYSDRIMMSGHNSTNMHTVDTLLTGVNTNFVNSMFDVSFGQVFPTSAAAEILGVDASGSVYVVQKVTNQWQGSILWQDTNALYGVIAADLLPNPGDEVLAAGASGAVTLLLNPTPVLNVALTADRRTVLSWNGVTDLTYTLESSTNLVSHSSWTHVTNLVYEGGFSGALTYTNPSTGPAEQWFRVKASW